MRQNDCFFLFRFPWAVDVAQVVMNGQMGLETTKTDLCCGMYIRTHTHKLQYRGTTFVIPIKLFLNSQRGLLIKLCINGRRKKLKKGRIK